MTKNSHAKFFLAVLASATLGTSLVSPGYAASKVDADQTGKKPLKAGIETFAVLSEAVQTAAGMKCNSTDRGVFISQVEKQSPADQGNLEKGDQVLAANLSTNTLHIKVERNGRIYEAALTVVVPGSPLVKESPSVDNPVAQPSTSGASGFRELKSGCVPWSGSTAPDGKNYPSWYSPGLVEDTEKLISRYNIELMLDWSPSIEALDAPPGTRSRKDWLKEQITVLLKAIQNKGGDVTLTVCHNNRLTVFEHLRESDLSRIFAANWNSKGNTMADLLDIRVNDFFTRRRKLPGAKPLLLSVITDMHPNDCYHKVSVAAFTKRMQDPREVVIGFSVLGPDWQNNGWGANNGKQNWTPEPKRFNDDVRKSIFCNYFGARYPIIQITGPVILGYTGLTRCLCWQAEKNLRDVDANGWSNLLDPDPYMRPAINLLASEFGSFDRDTLNHGNPAQYNVKHKTNLKDLTRIWGQAWSSFPLSGVPWPSDPNWTDHLLIRISQSEMVNY